MSVYPATNSNEAVELIIDGGNQLHDIINETADKTVTTESGEIPSVRKAIADSLMFLEPLPWKQGESETNFLQIRSFNSELYWAPSATISTPKPMGVSPVGDTNWKLSPLRLDKSSILSALGNVNKGFWDEDPKLENSKDFVVERNTGNVFGAISLPYQVDSSDNPDPNALVPSELIDVSNFATEEYVDQKLSSVISNKVSFFESDTDLQSTSEDVLSNATVITSHHSSQQDHNGSTYEVIEAVNHVGVIEEFGDIQMQNGNIAVKAGYSNETSSIRYWSHRGGFRGTVENTLYAFSKALDDGAYGIEADISWSSDGVPYVFHDIDVSLLTNGTGNIYDLTSTQINNLRFKAVVGTRYENLVRIPTLAQFIEFCERKACPVTLELKLPRPASQESDRQAAIDMIKVSPIAKNFVIQVTTGSAAEQVRNSTLDVKTAFSYASFTNYLTELYDFKKWRVNQLQISSDSLSNPNADQAIELAKKLGFELIGYTSQNTKTNVNTLASKGFFNIISDRGYE